MLSDVMNYFGLKRTLDHVGYFETEDQTHLFKELKPQIKQGRLIALSGVVGCGKTTTLQRLQVSLAQEKDIIISRSLAVDKDKVNLGREKLVKIGQPSNEDLSTPTSNPNTRLSNFYRLHSTGTLMTALFYDLTTQKDIKLPTQPEQRERKLLALIQKCRKPVVLLVDEAHELHSRTLVRIKRLIELVRQNGGILSVLLAGHPKLKNDLLRPTLEEIGARASIFSLEGIRGHQQPYIKWLLSECIHDSLQPDNLVTEEAIAVLAERLTTPLQIEHYLKLAFEKAYEIGTKPITTDVIETILAVGINDLEPHLIRHGYNTKALADLLNVRTAEVRSFLHGQLPPGRTQDLRDQLLKIGIPL